MPQAGGAGTNQPPATTAERDQLRESIRQTIQDARRAADEGNQQVIVVPAPGTPTPPANPDFFTETGTPFPDDIPPRVFDMGIAFLFTMGAIIIGYPLAKAIGKWIVSYSEPAKLPADLTAQLSQINHSVDAIAIEVERISEAQRFTTKLLAEKTEPARLPGSARE